MARLEGERVPERLISLRETYDPATLPLLNGQPPEPGAAFVTRNLWLCYPGRVWVVSLKPESRVLAGNDHPAQELLMLLGMDVERDVYTDVGKVVDGGTLILDGVERKAWQAESGGVVCRVIETGSGWVAAICPVGEVDAVRLLTG